MDIIGERLRNQYLTGRRPARAQDIIQCFGAVQAQEVPGAKWALAQRLLGASNDQLDKLYDDGEILRTHVLRPTWHFVLPEDIRWMLELTAPRIAQAMAYYNRKLELDTSFFTRSNTIIGEALAGGKFLTRAELAQALESHGIEASGQRLGHIVMQAELDAVICSGPMRGKQFTYALLSERAPQAKSLGRDESLALLAERYFSSHGPALLKDFAWWSGLTMADARTGLQLCGGKLSSVNINGKEYWFKESTTASGQPPKFMLLSVYDEYIISYSDYSPTFPPESQSLTRLFGNAWLNYVVVRDGQVIGSLRRRVKPKAMELEFWMLARLTTSDKALLEQEAEKFAAFFGLRPHLIFNEQ